jgi:hypothetical protein
MTTSFQPRTIIGTGVVMFTGGITALFWPTAIIIIDLTSREVDIIPSDMALR